jgi:hypothetical protein
MTRLRIGLLAVLLAAVGATYAQDDQPAAPAGTWKLTLPTMERQTRGFPIVLVKFDKDKKDKDKWAASVVAAHDTFPFLAKSEIEKISVNDKTWKFTIKNSTQDLECEINLGKDPKATKFYGEMRAGRGTIPVEVQRTTMTAIDSFEFSREAIATEPPGIRVVQLARMLLPDVAEKKVKPAQVRAWADKALASAALYGPSVAREELLLIARTLAGQEGHEATALRYAEKAESGLRDKSDSATVKRVLDVLALAQEKAGRKQDAAKTQLRIKKLTFPIKLNKYAGRKAKSDRVVLAELFTASNDKAKPCVPADAAAAALLKSYKPSEVAVLVYQQHMPETIGNPLSSPESEERLEYYERQVQNLPALVLDGRFPVPGGGGPEDSQEVYDNYRDGIDQLLERESKAEVKVSAARKDGKISISAEVGNVKEAEKKVRLRVALVETQTDYRGGSGTLTHYHVVRWMAGGSEGTAVTKGALKKTFTVDEKELRKELSQYQDKVNEARPFPAKGYHKVAFMSFPIQDRPLDLKNFKVIAFVQNDMTKEVLQAAQADVKEPMKD